MGNSKFGFPLGPDIKWMFLTVTDLEHMYSNLGNLLIVE